jgi:hypothetical protein
MRGRFPPDRQRRFDRAFTEIERLCQGGARHNSDWPISYRVELGPADIERVRWFIVAMARARATPGSAAIERLAQRGYAISTGTGTLQTTPDVVALDTPGFVRLGHVLPSSRRPWKWIEAVALDVDPEAWPERRWCSAHASLQIRAALAVTGGRHVSDDLRRVLPAASGSFPRRRRRDAVVHPRSADHAWERTSPAGLRAQRGEPQEAPNETTDPGHLGRDAQARGR